jgi:hypothetical protein
VVEPSPVRFDRFVTVTLNGYPTRVAVNESASARSRIDPQPSTFQVAARSSLAAPSQGASAVLRTGYAGTGTGALTPDGAASVNRLESRLQARQRRPVPMRRSARGENAN